MNIFETNKLSGVALDWGVVYAQVVADVCRCRGGDKRPLKADHEQAKLIMGETIKSGLPSPSTDWSIGGRIMESASITVFEESRVWFAVHSNDIASYQRDLDGTSAQATIYEEDTVQGETLLIAAMRCYVLKTIGEKIEIPENLTQQALILEKDKPVYTKLSE